MFTMNLPPVSVLKTQALFGAGGKNDDDSGSGDGGDEKVVPITGKPKATDPELEASVRRHPANPNPERPAR